MPHPGNAAAAAPAPEASVTVPAAAPVWTQSLAGMQQLWKEHLEALSADALPNPLDPRFWIKAWGQWLEMIPAPDPQRDARIAAGTAEIWREALRIPMALAGTGDGDPAHIESLGEQLKGHPAFLLIREAHRMLGEHMLSLVDSADQLDGQEKERIRFALKNVVEAANPDHFLLTNPAVIARTIETGGANLVAGLGHLLADLRKGQLTHTDPGAFRIGENIATTPGKVVHRAPLYEILQYSPATEDVLAVPLVIFPPWINRFYVLDLNPQKSFIRWAVEQGVTVFVISWKSADASLAGVTWDDYVEGQIAAIDFVRERLGVPAVHTIGYCVAGTTLAATLAVMARRGQADKVRSATFLTAQVDFELAGDLKAFVDDSQIEFIGQLTENGFLDGRYMAATFNLLRSRDLIWNYVLNNYLLGEDYKPFDLLHWNGDTTNLPARWHRSYLSDLYRDNLLVVPDALRIGDTPIDLRLIATPCYIQAGREDHISPAASVWRLTQHLAGPWRFVLAGSGHIAGVVNPPAARKYQHWVCDRQCDSFESFVATAQERPGSWWPDWLEWLRTLDDSRTAALGPRSLAGPHDPGLGDAPGQYVLLR